MSDPDRSGDVGEAESMLANAEASLAGLDAGRLTARPPNQRRRELPAIGTFGPYEIVGRLAMGGMAEILLGRETSPDAGSRHLVVKRILAEYGTDKAFIDMFLDEARVMMRLRHPNVCHVYKFGQHEGAYYIAMEWVEGASLGKLIRQARKTGGVPVAVACHIAASVAEALDHAHNAEGQNGQRLSIVHRDVTPDNIMVSYDGAVKLLDFGIAKAEVRAHQTQAGVVKGKFAYMAPEQCRGKELDHRVDIFALGVCLFQTLTQRPLYRRETEFETMEAIVRGPVPKLADMMKNPPLELEPILAKCLAKKPEDRWQTAAALQEALQQVIAKRGEVVTGGRVREMMNNLFAAEKQQGPIIDSTPFGSSIHAGSDTAALFEMDSGEMPAFPDDLPVPELPLEPTVTPAYQGPPGVGIDLEENHRPGHATGSSGALGLRQDARPPPTAPSRPVFAPQEVESGGGRAPLFAGIAIGLLGLAGFGAWFVMTQLGPQDVVATELESSAVLVGTLVMASDPAGASLSVDGEDRGVTPVTVEELSTGTHRVILSLEGYETHDATVEIRAGRTNSILQPLEALPEEGAPEPPTALGRVNLTSTPIVRVFHDGRDLGQTPLRNLRLPVGVVPLELELPNGTRVRRAVMVSADETRATHLNID